MPDPTGSRPTTTSPRCGKPILGAHPRTGAEVILTNELHADHARTLVTAAG